MGEQRSIAVVSAGLSQPSSTRLLADRLAAATRDSLAERDLDARIEVVELREHAHAITDKLLSGFAGATLSPILDQMVRADGLIAVTPTWNASYSGLFKSFVDVLPEGALAGKPVVIGATGGSARHSLVTEHALRPLFTYLRAVVLPTAVYAASEDWGAGAACPDGSGAAGRRLSERIARAGSELADQLTGQRSGADNRAPDGFTRPVEFAELLADVAEGRRL